MISSFRVARINRRGYGEVMKSEGVRAFLRERAEPVRARANASSGNSHFLVDDTSPGSPMIPQRGVVRVATDSRSAMRDEADTGYLSSSADGGSP